MRPSTRSAGKPKTPMRSDERMTRLVTLSRASPRKPLTSPAAAQRGARPPCLALSAARGRGAGCAACGRSERAGGAAGSALVEPARETLLAAFFVDERGLATLLAEIADAPALVGVRRRAGRLDLADMLGQRAAERVGEREDLARAEAHRLGAADARELADDLFESALRRQRRR